MIRNYIKVAFRTLLRNKTAAIINITGLSAAITSCMLIFLFVQDELCFDKFNSKYERIYRITETRKEEDNSVRRFSYTAGPAAGKIKNDIPGVESTTRIISRYSTGRFAVQYKESKFYEGEHIFGEPSFFNVFDFDLVQGDKKTALTYPNSVILTEKTALKFLGVKDVVGKTLSIERIGDVKITGVLKDLPANSHLYFSMILSIATLEQNEGWRNYANSWDSDGFLTYIVLNNNSNFKPVQAALNNISNTNISKAEGERMLNLQPMKDIHFYSADIEDDLNLNPGNISYIYIFSAAAIFILFIACINFINLSTAKSIRRAKEAGLRKVLGASRKDLIKQFIGESFVQAVIALLVSIILLEIILPGFNSFTGKNITGSFTSNPGLMIAAALVVLLTGFLAGSYPAFFISSHVPAGVLKGNDKIALKSPAGRKTLIVIQFALSVVIITSTIFIYRQLNYIQNKPAGFNKEHKIIVDINSKNARNNFQSIKNEFLKSPHVLSAAVSSRVPGDWKDLVQAEVIPGAGTSGRKTLMYFMSFDEDMLSTYDIKLVSGRNFSAEMGSDSSALLINASAARILGWENTDGRQLHFSEAGFTGNVIGVVRDFHFQSLHKKIEPMIIGFRNNPIQAIDYFTVKISGKDIPGTLDHLKAVHAKYDVVTPLEYNFLDERIREYYVNEERTGTLFTVAAVIAVILACLGLFALSSYTVELKTKEIGIRKVLGASVPGIVKMLTGEFLLLIIISNIIAVPAAYLFMKSWLQDFAYSIDIEIYTFLLTALLVLFISVITISFRAVKAALANPVNALKYE